jgi:Antitoxin VbhA
VEGSADDHEPTDIAAMLSDSDLSAENRRYVHNALACSMLEGWRPTRESVALLIDALAGNITADEYRARVVASAATRRMSRVPWNFDGGPVSIRLRSPHHCA